MASASAGGGGKMHAAGHAENPISYRIVISCRIERRRPAMTAGEVWYLSCSTIDIPIEGQRRRRSYRRALAATTQCASESGRSGRLGRANIAKPACV